MFSELDRSWIRWALGYSAVFIQADPSLEAAITAAQSTADDGSRPDSSSENFCKGILYGFAAVTGTSGVTPGPFAQNVTFAMPARRGLLTVWASIDALDYSMGATQADGGDAKIDVARERVRLCMEGRRLIHAISTMLSTAVVKDIFGSPEIDPSGNVFHFNRPETAWDGFAEISRASGRHW